MNPLAKVFSLFVAVLTGGGSDAQRYPEFWERDYPLQPSFLYDEADRITALSIVECVKVGEDSRRNWQATEDRTLVGEASPRWVRVETVRVVDSSSLRAATVVRLVVGGNGREAPAYRMALGRRYLVLASLPRRNRLETPDSGRFDSGTFSTAAMPDEVSGLAAFETCATALDRSPDLPDGIANSVVDCLTGANVPETQRITRWLLVAGYPGGGIYNNLFGREDFPLSRRIRRLAKALPIPQKIATFQLLCDWKVFGSEQLFVDALIEGAGDPNALRAAPPLNGGELSFSQVRRARDPNYHYIRLGGNDWADVVAKAKNPGIQRLLLTDIPYQLPLDDAHKRKVAALIDSPYPTVQDAAIRRFADWIGRLDLLAEPNDESSARILKLKALETLRERLRNPAPFKNR